MFNLILSVPLSIAMDIHLYYNLVIRYDRSRDVKFICYHIWNILKSILNHFIAQKNIEIFILNEIEKKILIYYTI